MGAMVVQLALGVKDRQAFTAHGLAPFVVGAAGAAATKELVITRSRTPLFATATNFSCPAGPPQVTDAQLLSAADVCVVQVMPSGLVITRFPAPV